MSHCEWKPVDTIPKDGRFFYVISIGGVTPILARYNEMAIAIIVYLANGAQEFSEDNCNPTHWMPLPPPPEE